MAKTGEQNACIPTNSAQQCIMRADLPACHKAFGVATTVAQGKSSTEAGY